MPGGVRRWLRRLHLALAVAVGLLLVAIAGSGSILVFRHELAPPPDVTWDGASDIGWQAARDLAMAARPEGRLQILWFPTAARPWYEAAYRVGDDEFAAALRLHPADGRVLPPAPDGGALAWIEQFHIDLQLGGPGAWLVRHATLLSVALLMSGVQPGARPLAETAPSCGAAPGWTVPLILSLAVLFHFSRWSMLTVVTGLALAGLMLWRLELGLALVAAAAPFYLHPRPLFGKAFSMVELAVLLSVVAWGIGWLDRWLTTARAGGIKGASGLRLRLPNAREGLARHSPTSLDLAVGAFVLIALASLVSTQRLHLALLGGLLAFQFCQRLPVFLELALGFTQFPLAFGQFSCNLVQLLLPGSFLPGNSLQLRFHFAQLTAYFVARLRYLNQFLRCDIILSACVFQFLSGIFELAAQSLGLVLAFAGGSFPFFCLLFLPAARKNR